MSTFFSRDGNTAHRLCTLEKSSYFAARLHPQTNLDSTQALQNTTTFTTKMGGNLKFYVCVLLAWWLLILYLGCTINIPEFEERWQPPPPEDDNDTTVDRTNTKADITTTATVLKSALRSSRTADKSTGKKVSFLQPEGKKHERSGKMYRRSHELQQSLYARMFEEAVSWSSVTEESGPANASMFKGFSSVLDESLVKESSKAQKMSPRITEPIVPAAEFEFEGWETSSVNYCIGGLT